MKKISIHTLPCFAIQQCRDGPVVNAEVPTQLTLTNAYFVKMTNLTHVVLSQLGIAVGLPLWLPLRSSLRHTVVRVICLRSLEQVGRIATRTIVAAMQRARLRPPIMLKIEGNAVSGCQLAEPHNCSVPGRVLGPPPPPPTP